MMRPIEREARERVSASREESGWKWKFRALKWDIEVQSPRAYKQKQSALRAGRREYRRFFGPSIAAMIEDPNL